jgi:hypothetical protein
LKSDIHGFGFSFVVDISLLFAECCVVCCSYTLGWNGREDRVSVVRDDERVAAVSFVGAIVGGPDPVFPATGAEIVVTTGENGRVIVADRTRTQETFLGGFGVLPVDRRRGRWRRLLVVLVTIAVGAAVVACISIAATAVDVVVAAVVGLGGRDGVAVAVIADRCSVDRGLADAIWQRSRRDYAWRCLV